MRKFKLSQKENVMIPMLLLETVKQNLKSMKKVKNSQVDFEDTSKFLLNLLYLGSREVVRLTNHPVHFVNDENVLNPTALIPFCEFQNNMSVMGENIDKLDVPVCNSFRPKIIKDQVCYTVDPNEYKHRIDLNGELSLSIFIHSNEDRQMEDPESTQQHFIILETIGKPRSTCINKSVYL